MPHVRIIEAPLTPYDWEQEEDQLAPVIHITEAASYRPTVEELAVRRRISSAVSLLVRQAASEE